MKTITVKIFISTIIASILGLLLLPATKHEVASTKTDIDLSSIKPGTVIPHPQVLLGADTNGVQLPTATPYDDQPGLKPYYLKGFCQGYHLTITNREPGRQIQLPGFVTQPQPAYEIAEDKGFLAGQDAGYQNRPPVPSEIRFITNN